MLETKLDLILIGGLMVLFRSPRDGGPQICEHPAGAPGPVVAQPGVSTG
jgi:hypothetical protein